LILVVVADSPIGLIHLLVTEQPRQQSHRTGPWDALEPVWELVLAVSKVV